MILFKITHHCWLKSSYFTWFLNTKVKVKKNKISLKYVYIYINLKLKFGIFNQLLI